MSDNYPQYIDNSSDLVQFCDHLKNYPWFAIDTEFLREKTYFPKLCLIQIGVPGHYVCIDPLSIEDLTPLMDIIFDPQTLKVFHAAGQDLEIFYHLGHKVPVPIFDTQIAAPLLGHNEQMGYANLVMAITGISLDKSHTRTDWSKRPLNEKQIEYALNDVIHLVTVYESLSRDLQASHRESWLTEDFKNATDESRFKPSPDTVWKKIKLSRKMSGKKLAILKKLAAWREEQAIKSNKPRSWIIKDDVIADLAIQQPDSKEELQHIRSLADRTRQKNADIFLKIIREVKNSGIKEEKTVFEKPLNATAEQEAMTDLLMAVLRTLGTKENINPASLATRKDLLKILTDIEDVPLMKGWRFQMAGKIIKDVVSGKQTISVIDKQLRLQEPISTGFNCHIPVTQL